VADEMIEFTVKVKAKLTTEPNPKLMDVIAVATGAAVYSGIVATNEKIGMGLDDVEVTDSTWEIY
jgi:hypothetical protein